MIDLSTDDQRRYYLVGYLYGQRGDALPAEYQQSASGDDLGVAAKFGYLDAKEKRASRVTLPGSDAAPNADPVVKADSAPKTAPKEPSKKSPTVDALNKPGDNRVKPETASDIAAYRDGFEGRSRGAFSSSLEKAWYEAGKLDQSGKQTARAERPVAPTSTDWTWPALGAAAAAMGILLLIGRRRR